MAISNTLRDGIDKMCVYAQRALLGTIVQTLQNDVDALEVVNAEIARGTAVADADDQTAGSKTIDTGVTINGFIVQIYRANLLLTAYDVQASTTELTIATNGTDYVVTDGDVINYIVY